MHLNIVTTEESVYSGDIDLLVAPGIEGLLGILPRHAPLLTVLSSGNVLIRKDGKDEEIMIKGGFLEVTIDSDVTILANS
ncbi:MAG: ATP synthase F1 subunit epsilon [Chloroflexi bacterium]|nr:ATP synthase F1 subunit epsilon [Chloroflexota bacterium]MBS19953.1 ATP synthase F1 subunit epsilon [Chloroflexota bacterium]